ncbi:MAG TPA: hypothetical protein PLH37_02805 [bacterium]|nr:hypothetical protein [bacterium]
MTSKIKKIFIISLISIAVLAIGFFILKKYLFKSQQLVDFLPAETLAYFEFNPHDKNLIELQNQSVKIALNLEKMWAGTGWWGDLKKTAVLPQIEKIGLVFFKNSQQKIWLLKTKGDFPEALLPPSVFVRILDKNILAFSADNKILNDFIETNKVLPATDTQKTIYNKFSAIKFFNAYLSATYWVELGQNNSDLNNLFFNQLNLNSATPLYFSLRADDRQVVVNAQAVGNSTYQSVDILASDRKLWQKVLGQDFFAAWQVADLKTTITTLEQELTSKLGAKEFNAQKEEWAKKYNFVWDDFYDIISNPAVLFWKNSFSDIWIGKSPTNTPMVVLIKTDDAQKINTYYQKLKDFFSYLIAFEHPSATAVLLKDGTKIKKLTADPTQIKWQTGGQLEYFQSDEIVIALIKDGAKIYMANDVDFLKNLFYTNTSSTSVCPDFIGQEIVYYRTKTAQSVPLKFLDQLVLTIDRHDEGINIKGCLIW